ncbi:MAG: hypothetical protein ABII26_04765 [Pseudomonadota bacterium]
MFACSGLNCKNLIKKNLVFLSHIGFYGHSLQIVHEKGDEKGDEAKNMIHEMEKRGLRRGLAGLCGGGGHGQAIILEKIL